MYIWVALDVSEALSEVRARAMNENRAVGLCEVAFSLPQHVSLKISFSVDDGVADQVIERLTSFFKDFLPVPIRPLALEENDGLLWIKIEESAWLSSLHSALDRLLLREFSLPQHPYDKVFLFHSTLFLDTDTEKIARMAERLSDLSLPEEILPEGFLIGTSESGRAGSYQVVKTVRGKRAL